MALPLATTTISVKRPNTGATTDPWEAGDDEADSFVIRGVPAHISVPSGFENAVGGSQEVVTFRLNSELCDLRNTDRVYDERTELTYEVVWTEERRGLGLDHRVASLKLVTGTAA